MHRAALAGVVAVILALLSAFACLGLARAQALSWPQRPARIIVPFAPGGAADTLGRLIANHLSSALHEQFYAENRTGAGGIVGTAAVAAAEPDGYTLAVSGIASNVISPALYPHAGYDGLRDFTHIAYLGGPPTVMLVHPSLGVRTFPEFVALARGAAHPINYVSPGPGSHGSLIAQLIAAREGYKINHIPYKGAGPALTDLVAGHVLLGSTTFSSAAEQIRAGNLVALAVTTEKRIVNFPEIPTFRELGEDLVSETWFGLSGPAHLPSDIVSELNRETLSAMQLPEVRRRLALESIETRLMTPPEFTAFIQQETARWAPLARSLVATPR